MAQKKKLSWKDHQTLLEFLVSHDVKQASQHFKISEGAIRNRLYNIRKQLSETQAALNKIRTLQRVSPRIRKYTTQGKIVPDEESDLAE